MARMSTENDLLPGVFLPTVVLRDFLPEAGLSLCEFFPDFGVEGLATTGVPWLAKMSGVDTDLRFGVDAGVAIF